MEVRPYESQCARDVCPVTPNGEINPKTKYRVHMDLSSVDPPEAR